MKQEKQAIRIMQRIEKHVSTAKVAIELGLHQNTVLNIVREKSKPARKETVPKMYKAFVAEFDSYKKEMNAIKTPELFPSLESVA